MLKIYAGDFSDWYKEQYSRIDVKSNDTFVWFEFQGFLAVKSRVTYPKIKPLVKAMLEYAPLDDWGYFISQQIDEESLDSEDLNRLFQVYDSFGVMPKAKRSADGEIIFSTGWQSG